MALENIAICDTTAGAKEICDFVSRWSTDASIYEDGVVRYTLPGLAGTVLPASDLLKVLVNEVYHFVPTRKFIFRNL